ncbi:MAG: HAD-IA family hydrolase [Pseudomonadota bacterium]
MAPKALVLDIGNVLMRWDPDQLYGKLLDEEERAKLMAEVDLHGMNEAVDRGAPFKETVYALAEQHPEYGDLIRMWHDRWIEMARPLIPGSWAVLRHFRKMGVPVMALSNFGVETFAYAEGVYPELKEFDRRFISGHMRVIKPEAEIYARLEAETGLSGSEIFFADDRADNIAAAEARGWVGHVFATPERLATAAAEAFGVDVRLD